MPKKNADRPWLDYEEPQIIFFQGMRGAGKSVTVAETTEKLYNKGFLVLHVWGARSLENLYYAINKDCKKHYSKLKIIVDVFFDQSNQGSLRQRCASKGLMGIEYDEYYDSAIHSGLIEKISENKFKVTDKGIKLHRNELLHCNCNRAVPITVMSPDYNEFDQDGVDRFNSNFYRDMKHYSEYNSEITSTDKELLVQGKLRISDHIHKTKPIIKIRKFTTPTSADRKKKFYDEFVQIVLDARKEHRIVVMNPSLFDGEMDKFHTLAEIFRIIPNLMTNSGHFKPLKVSDVGRPKNKWTKYEKNHHRIAIIINEIRSVAPSSNLHGEKDAGISKKAVFSFVPEARQFNTHFLADYQDADDLYAGVKKQANLTIIKRGSRNILGDNYSWLFEKVERDRVNMAMSYCKKNKGKKIAERIGGKIKFLRVVENQYLHLKEYLDYRRPYVDALPDNKAYVVWTNQEIKLITTTLPSWHHRGSTESFLQDTGISWTVNKDKKPEEKQNLTKREKKDVSKNHKKNVADIIQRITYWRKTEKKSWDDVKHDLIILQTDGTIQPMGFEEKLPSVISKWYSRQFKKQTLMFDQ